MPDFVAEGEVEAAFLSWMVLRIYTLVNVNCASAEA